MENLEEKVSLRVKKKSSFIIGALAVGVLFNVGCGPTSEEECCDCVVGNGCIDSSIPNRSTCENKLHKNESVKVYTSCAKENGCYAPCVEAGAYFQ